jgi:hypothetical protein
MEFAGSGMHPDPDYDSDFAPDKTGDQKHLDSSPAAFPGN